MCSCHLQDVSLPLCYLTCKCCCWWPPLCRFFPCDHSNSHNSIDTASQLHRELTAEQIAALQQGSAAWHLGRSGHITGSNVTDLLGFDSPAVNRLLAAHGVYHAVKDGRQGVAKLQAATAKLWGEAAAAAAARMGPFGVLCCEFGNRCASHPACCQCNRDTSRLGVRHHGKNVQDVCFGRSLPRMSWLLAVMHCKHAAAAVSAILKTPSGALTLLICCTCCLQARSIRAAHADELRATWCCPH
jgi:hypothetical protein